MISTIYVVLKTGSVEILVKEVIQEVESMRYRIVIELRSGRELYGNIEYDTKELAEARADYFRAHHKKVKVVPNSYFGLSK